MPDLPGHGRTDGPFSYERSDKCSENLVRELIARGLLDPERTILAGHSLGGAIALRVASRVPVAGVVAFSPAPMRPIPGVSPEMMPFQDFGALPAHSLLMSAAWEPQRIRDAVKSLLPSPNDGTSEYVVIPRSTHVSILFDGTAMSDAQNWAARVLHLESQPTLPSHRGSSRILRGLRRNTFVGGTLSPRNFPEQEASYAPLPKTLPLAQTAEFFSSMESLRSEPSDFSPIRIRSARCIYSKAITSQAFCSFSEPSFSFCTGIRCEIYSAQARATPSLPGRCNLRFSSLCSLPFCCTF